MSNAEQLRSLGNQEKPFTYLEKEPCTEWGNEECNKKHRFLEALNLNTQSTVDEVKRVAISLRRKDIEGGLNRDTRAALRWALQTTRNAINPMEFVFFMENDKTTFEDIEICRFIENV